MNKATDILLSLLRSAIGSDSTAELKGLPLSVDARLSAVSAEEWQQVIDMAFEQGVDAISVDGYNASLSLTLPSREGTEIAIETEAMEDLKFEWFGSVLQAEEDYRHSWEVACELSRLWASVGIRATVLKGRSIAQYYPKPSHRYSCDLDVFIPAGGDWEKACELLKGKGIKLEYEVYKEVEFTYRDVYVECHRYITPVRGNKNLLGFERYLRSLLEAESSTFEGTSLVCPPLMFTALLYVEHALGDFLRGPLTLKHLCDWMVIRKQPVHWPTFNDHCREYGFWRFLQLVDALCDVIEGKKRLEDLPESYRRAFEEIFQARKGSTHRKSWTARRMNQFFDVLKCGWKYKSFGYMTMSSYLYHTLWTHWFDKEVKV